MIRGRGATTAAALPDAVELVILAVRAGMSPSGAVRAVANDVDERLRPGFAEVVHRLHRGQRLADALDALPEMVGPDASGFADGLATADRYGLPLEPVLDQLAAETRAHRRREAERHARTLPVRLAFPLVVCTLPSFVLLAIVPAVLGALSTLRG
ncbi:MAG: type II secretion system F family protein [Ilumatobacter sp.]|uniref:type II secretion system F family protein n=1 Tax=Ilumatobacter sp. TaxID=1967498 RepID=UPI00260749F8|nr:type II secretion system F family protein [Ilumatobacter sp.]MDJ0770330.1 type II secretion system F family protein [Ilumatobacter sp.]